MYLDSAQVINPAVYVPPPPKPTYQPTAPARYAASVLMRNFKFFEIGKWQVSQHNVACLIDLGSRIYAVTPAFQAFRRALPPYWRSDAVGTSMERVKEAVRALEMVCERLPRYEEGKGSDYEPDAMSVMAARRVIQEYDLEARKHGKVRLTERNIAIIIDVSTRSFDIGPAIAKLARTTLPLDKHEWTASVGKIQQAIRVMDVVTRRMPVDAPALPPAMTAWSANNEEDARKADRANLRKVALALDRAQTADEYRKIAQSAGIVR